MTSKFLFPSVKQQFEQVRKGWATPTHVKLEKLEI